MNRPYFVHMDAQGRLQVLREGEPPVETLQPGLREQVERHAAQLRQRELDEAAAAVSRWAGRWVVRCAVQFPLAMERVTGAAARP
jgi:hypothetical protein